MHASQPPAPRRKNSPLAMGIMIGATILYGLSLFPWVIMLIMSPMAYSSPDAVPSANLLLISLLGWPVAILAGLIVGWWKRTVKAATIGAAVPLVWIFVMMGGGEIVNPSFFNVADFLPAPVVLEQADRELAGVALFQTPDSVVAVLGAPDEARVDGETVAPAGAVAATADSPAAMWTYTSSGLVLHFYDGVLHEVEAEASWTGQTPRGLKLGDSMDQVTALYGDTKIVSFSITPEGRSDTRHFRGRGFGLVIHGDTNGQVQSIYLRTQE